MNCFVHPITTRPGQNKAFAYFEQNSNVAEFSTRSLYCIWWHLLYITAVWFNESPALFKPLSIYCRQGNYIQLVACLHIIFTILTVDENHLGWYEDISEDRSCVIALKNKQITDHILNKFIKCQPTDMLILQWNCLSWMDWFIRMQCDCVELKKCTFYNMHVLATFLYECYNVDI